MEEEEYQKKLREVIETLNGLLELVYATFTEDKIDRARLDIYNYVTGYLGVKMGPHV